MSKYVENQIAALKTMATVTIPGIINNGGTMAAVTEYKAKMNKLALTILTGSEEVVSKKGETKLKFTKELPTTAQVADIAEVLDNYYEQVELPFINAGNGAEDFVDDDEDADIKFPKFFAMPSGVTTLGDKVKNKDLQKFVLDPMNAVANITSKEVIRIAAYGIQARKDANFKKALIIGGITVAIVGGVTAGIIIACNNKKKSDAEAEGDVIDADYEEIDDDIDASDVAEQVELSEEFNRDLYKFSF